MKSYVYIIQNKDRTHWYVGYKQKPKTGEDYWGSSKYLKKLMKESGKENWTKTIVNEFDTAAEASEHEIELLEFLWSWPGRVNKARNGVVDHSDPEVKAKHKAASTAANQKKAQDPEYRVKHNAALQKSAQNPEHRANRKAANQKSAQNPEHRANRKAANQKSAQNPEHRANHKAATTLANQKRRKPFIATSITTGEEFFCESQECDQVKSLGLTPSKVSNCLNGRLKTHKGFKFRYAE